MVGSWRTFKFALDEFLALDNWLVTLIIFFIVKDLFQPDTECGEPFLDCD